MGEGDGRTKDELTKAIADCKVDLVDVWEHKLHWLPYPSWEESDAGRGCRYSASSKVHRSRISLTRRSLDFSV
jgi:hypothetical protein